MAQGILAAEFAELDVISYDNAVQSGENVVGIVAAHCGVPFDPQTPFGGEDLNRSDPLRKIDRLRLFNGVRALHEGLDQDPFLAGDGRMQRDVFFDQAADVGGALTADEGLAVALDDCIAATLAPVEIPPEAFAGWASALEACVAAHLVNPLDGRLFANPATRRLEASTLEAADLPADLQKRMLDAMAAARRPRAVAGADQGLARAARFARRLARRVAANARRGPPAAR